MPNRTELTDKLQRVRGMVEYVRENLDGDEYEAFLDMVAPLLEVEVTAKKPQKKSTKKSGVRCQAELVSGAKCNMTASHGIHDEAQKKNYAESHEFLSKSSSKSQRASGMAAQLKSRTDEQRQATTNRTSANDDDNQQRCTVLRDDNKPCGLLPDHNVHHMKSARGYHPFESSNDAPPAAGESLSSSGVESGDGVSSGIWREDARAVAGGSNE